MTLRELARDYLDRAWSLTPEKRVDDLVSTLKLGQEQGAKEMLNQVSKLYETLPPAEFAKALALLKGGGR